MNGLTLAASQPWLITSQALDNILTIAARENDIQALETRLGQQLEYTHTVTTRGSVALIPVTGPIFRYANLFTRISGATSTEVLAQDIQAALDNPRIKSIVLNVNSPGGVASGINELAALVKAGRDKKRIVAYVGGEACSAAYWIASAAHEVVIDDTALAGSIGAVLTVTVRPGAKDGTQRYEIVSQNAPNKRPDLTTEAGREKVGEVINALGAVFQQKVAENLGVNPDDIPAMGDHGGVKIGAAAVAAGLAHRLGSLENLITELNAPTPPTTKGNHPMTKTVVKTTAELHAALAAGTAAENIEISQPVPVTLDSFDLTEVKAQARTEERERIAAITALAQPGFEAEVQAAIENGSSAEAAAMAILTASKDRGISLTGIKNDSTQAATTSPTTENEQKAAAQAGLVSALLRGAGKQ